MHESIKANKELDVTGEMCPFPWVKASKALSKLPIGGILRIVGDHGPALVNIPQNFGDEGQAVLKAERTDGIRWEIVVRKDK